MIKKLRVTVDGNTYDVVVEMADEPDALTASPGAVSAPVAPLAAPSPSPALAPVAPQPQSPAPAPTPTPAAGGFAGPGDMPSPLAGRVTAVVVQVGQEVKEGDHLLTLEAMKMNTFVFAPRAGKIAEIKAAVGSAVEEGQTLMKIE